MAHESQFPQGAVFGGQSLGRAAGTSSVTPENRIKALDAALEFHRGSGLYKIDDLLTSAQEIEGFLNGLVKYPALKAEKATRPTPSDGVSG